jgi:acyl-CoA synthetase (AMP-forming)/AMP-acid ligase II
MLRNHASIRPDASAIIDERNHRRLTFLELEFASSRAASLLFESGIRAGDRALIFCPMSAELYVILSALFRLGAVAVFLDPSAGREHIEQCCSLMKPSALIATAKAHLLRLISPALRRIPVKFSVGPRLPGAINWSRAEKMRFYADIHSCEADAPALITFTSGSTARPKAAVRTHGFLLAQHRVLERTLRMAAGEINLATLPVFALANLASGATSLIPNADLRFPGRIDAAPVLAHIVRHRPQSAAASPAFFERLLDLCEMTGEKLSSLRKVFTGGAPVFPRLLQRLARAAPQAEIVAVYGSTEAEPIAELSYSDVSEQDWSAQMSGRGLLAGRAVAEIDLRIARFDSATFESLPPGEVGEILVSGEHVLKGYLDGEGDAETKVRLKGRVWHRTGDAGYLDYGGRLWLMGRSGARIEDSRGELYPFAVECAASAFLAARRSALALHRGRRVLCVEVEEMSRVEQAALRESLSWASLDEIRLYARLPLDRRHNAKIDYTALGRLLNQTS